MNRRQTLSCHHGIGQQMQAAAHVVHVGEVEPIFATFQLKVAAKRSRPLVGVQIVFGITSVRLTLE